MIHKYATGPRCHASSKAQGFTLLEVLIALSLFAVLSAMAFGGLNQLLSQHQQLQHHLSPCLLLKIQEHLGQQ